METIKKCIVYALNELSKVKFSGASVIPAGKAVEALYLAAHEFEKLKVAEKNQETDTKEEESDA